MNFGTDVYQKTIRRWRALWCVVHTRTNCAKHAYFEGRNLALLIFATASASMEGKKQMC